MLHPSYTELIKIVNSESEDSETPLVNSRYSIVLATAKRARQIIDGKQPMSVPKIYKPLSIAVDELEKGHLRIEPEVPGEDEIDIHAAAVTTAVMDTMVEEEKDEEKDEEMMEDMAEQPEEDTPAEEA